MRPPTEEELKQYTNSRGGYQPPDELIDLSEMPELTKDAKIIHRGPFIEYLKRRREWRAAEQQLPPALRN